jgi:hypothetical protein
MIEQLFVRVGVLGQSSAFRGGRETRLAEIVGGGA